VNAAAEALHAHAEDVGRRAVELTYRAVPAYAAALDARGRRHCEEDAVFHIRFLVGSLAAEDERIFVDYAAWCSALLAGYGIGAENLAAMFRATESAIRELVPEAWETASTHLEAGERALAA
jgi:hypothetical protein